MKCENRSETRIFRVPLLRVMERRRLLDWGCSIFLFGIYFIFYFFIFIFIIFFAAIFDYFILSHFILIIPHFIIWSFQFDLLPISPALAS